MTKKFGRSSVYLIVILTVCIFTEAFGRFIGAAKRVRRSSDDLESICDEPREELIKTGLKSKYFYAEGMLLNYQQASEYCEKNGLKMAEVKSQTDVDHLAQYVLSLASGEHKFMLEYKMRGDRWANEKGNPMTFQNFEPGLELSSKIPCVAIYFDDIPQMRQFQCDSVTPTLCQYREDDDCFVESAQETNKEEDELKPMDDIEEAQFFISTTKKTRSDAATTCEVSGAILLEIRSQIVNEKVFIMAREYAATLNIDPRTEFWTNGEFSDGSVVWSGMESFMPETVNYMWAEGSFGQCVTFSAELPTQIEGQVVSTFRTQSCSTPQYFICYSGTQPKDVLDSKDREEKNTDTLVPMEPLLPEPFEPEPEPEEVDEETTLPPFFENKNISMDPFPPASIPDRPREPSAPSPPKQSCYKITALPTIRADPENPLTTDEIIDLVIFSRDNHIEEDGLDIPYSQESEWRKELVMLLANIYTKACPGELIPKEYINTITVLISIYLNSVKEDFVQSKVGPQVWEELMLPLRVCAAKDSLTMTSKGMFAHEWVMGSANRINRILVPREKVDFYVPLNTVIEVFWSMFSLSMGNCMDIADHPTNWAVEYFDSFHTDFLDPLKEAWTMPLNFDIGVLIGDFDLETMNYNTRACTTAAYMRSGIADRQLVRPLDMSDKNTMSSLNEKTGVAVMNILT